MVHVICLVTRLSPSIARDKEVSRYPRLEHNKLMWVVLYESNMDETTNKWLWN